jgi:hypothetical protein
MKFLSVKAIPLQNMAGASFSTMHSDDLGIEAKGRFYNSYPARCMAATENLAP